MKIKMVKLQREFARALNLKLAVTVLSFALFAFIVPVEVSASKKNLTDKQRNLLIEEVKVAGANNRNPKDIADAMETIEKILGKMPADKKKNSKANPKLRNLKDDIAKFRSFMKLTADWKNAKTEVQKSNALANLSIEMLNAIEKFSGKKLGAGQAQCVSGIVLIGNTLIKAAANRVKELAWIEMVANSRGLLDDFMDDYKKLGSELCANGISAKDIRTVIDALEKLKNIK